MRVEIGAIDCCSYMLQPRKEVVFEYWYNDDLECWETSMGEFNHPVFGRSPEELKKEIETELRFMWEEFVLERDEVLASGALAAKYKMLKYFQEEKLNNFN